MKSYSLLKGKDTPFKKRQISCCLYVYGSSEVTKFSYIMATCSLIPLLASPLKGHRGKAIWYIRLLQKSRPESISTIACNNDTVVCHTA